MNLNYRTPSSVAPLKAYLITTGTLFVLLAAAHVIRAVQEPPLARDPWFLLTSVIAIVLAAWAFRLIRASRWPNRPPR